MHTPQFMVAVARYRMICLFMETLKTLTSSFRKCHCRYRVLIKQYEVLIKKYEVVIKQYEVLLSQIVKQHSEV